MRSGTTAASSSPPPSAWRTGGSCRGHGYISKITGNYNNTSSAGNSATEYNDPNTDPRFQPNREGRLTNDNTHIAKVLGSVRGSVGHHDVGRVLTTRPGQTFARTVRTTRAQTPQGRQDLFIEPRGSQRYDNQKSVDMRLEKQFRVGPDRRLGVTFEGFNVLQRRGD